MTAPAPKAIDTVTRALCYAIVAIAVVIVIRKIASWSFLISGVDRFVGIGIPCLVGGTAAWFSRASSNLRLSFLVVFVSTVSSLFAAELVLAFLRSREYIATDRFYGRRFYIEAERRGDRVYDPRPMYQVLWDLRRAGRNVWPYVSPVFWGRVQRGAGLPVGPLLPLGSLSRSVAILGNETGAPVFDYTDEHGFRNRPGKWKAPLDVVLLGDSFAHGCCVPFDESPTAHLDREYPRSLNLGLTGNGPLRALASFKEYAVPLRPRYAAWMFYEGNDWKDLDEERDMPILMDYLERGKTQNLVHRQEEIDGMLRPFGEKWLEMVARRPPLSKELWAEVRSAKWLKERLHFPLLRTRLGIATNLPVAPQDQEPLVGKEDLLLGLLERILKDAAKTAAGWNGKFIFVYCPDWRTVRNGNFVPPVSRERVLTAARAAGMEAVDLVPVMKSHPHPETLYTLDIVGTHFADEGYRLTVDEITRRMKSRSLSSPKVKTDR